MPGTKATAAPASIVLTDDMMELVAQLLMVRDDRKAAEKDEKELRDKLMKILDDAGAVQGLTEAGVAVAEIQIQHRRQVDRAKLEAMHPEVFDDVIEDKEVRLLKLNSWQ